MFRMRTGTLTRLYHPVEDRVVYTSEGDLSIDSIYFEIELGFLFGSVELDSSKFNLGINGNVSLNVASGTATVNQHVKLLPGAEVYVAKGATLTVSQSGSLVLFDKDHWVKNFAYYPATTNLNAGSNIIFNNAGTVDTVVRYSPTRAAVKGKPVDPAHGSAKLRVDGTLIAYPIRGKSGLITTLAGTDGYFCIDRD